MTQEENASPEEKLLRVIRSGGRQSAAPEAAAAADAVASKPAAPPADEPEATAVFPPSSAPVSAAPPREDAPSSAPAPVDSAPVTALPAAPRTRVARPVIAARFLALAALALVALAAWEVFGYFIYRRDTLPALREAGINRQALDLPDTAPLAVTGLPPLDEVLRRFSEQPLFSLFEDERQPVVERVRTDVNEWQRYADGHLRLLGMSVLDAEEQIIEAIIADSKTGAMHYLTLGDSLLVEQTRVTVETVARDHIVISDGTRRFELK